MQFDLYKAICYTVGGGAGTAWVSLTEVAPVLGQCLGKELNKCLLNK